MGNICRIAALDAATGRVVWSFPLIPTGANAGADSWPKGIRLAGGSNWTSLTLDPESGALYVPAGNPGPDFAGAYRPGANLFAGSVVVLDAKSGALRTWYQLVPHDVHDWDIAAAPALIATKVGPRLMTAGKDGFLHAIDLTAGKVAWKTPVTTIDNVDAPLTAQGTHFCPGTAGGVEWNGPAYSASSNLVYVNSVDWCAIVKLDPNPPKFEPGKPFIGSANGFGTMDASPKKGWLTAVDADTGAVRWRYQSGTPMVAGIVATAAGLVMTADLYGNLLAFDAATGNLLYKMETGQPAGGGVITYQQDGRQRIGLAAGLDSRIFGAPGHPTILVYGL
jgi:alcohol dehydrogenase (cytochrome c)